MYFIKTSAIRIPTSLSNHEWYQNIISDLTRKERDYNNPTVEVSKTFFDIRDGMMLLPRNYNVQISGHDIIDCNSSGEDIKIEFKSSFKNDLQKEAHNGMINSESCVLCMQPGEGKTVIAISVICTFKKKSIIFVHKDSLAVQWKERFLQHSDLKDDDVGMLKTHEHLEILKKPVVISTVQTLCSMIRRLPNIEKILHDANFGIAFWDECHTSVSAEMFSLSSLYLPVKRSYGLSATPSRSDGNSDIIEKHVGKIFIPSGSGQTLTPLIVVVQFNHGVLCNHREYIFNDFRTGKKEFSRERYLQMLVSKKNQMYVNTMKKVIKYIYNSKRITLFLSDRIKILDVGSEVIPKFDVGFFIPRSGENRDTDLLKKFVFSTYGSARDGTDRPQFDCLVMGTPTSNLAQCVGRVLRPYPGKLQPVVFDFVDIGCSQMEGLFENRKNFYERKNWNIEYRLIK
jgi:superfamily II DNA or RNA helicase